MSIIHFTVNLDLLGFFCLVGFLAWLFRGAFSETGGSYDSTIALMEQIRKNNTDEWTTYTHKPDAEKKEKENA